MRKLALIVALCGVALMGVASPAVALPSPIFEATAQSDETTFNPVADATDDASAIVANEPGSNVEPPRAYAAAIVFVGHYDARMRSSVPIDFRLDLT